MTDLEMTKFAAEAMGYKVVYPNDDKLPVCIRIRRGVKSSVYNPLHIDAQAMALVKKFRLWIQSESQKFWHVHSNEDQDIYGEGTDLNRAIVECVAQSQKREGG